jgi:hypothetical protein
MNCSRLLYAAPAVVTVLQFTACDPDENPIPGAPPTFTEVVATANGIRTGFMPDTPNANWTYFTHGDVFADGACGDMAVAADGIMRSLAVIRPDTGRTRALVIRTGLGPANWSTTFTTAVIPDTAGSNFGNVPQCTPLRMTRMRDGLHAIVWTNQTSDSLFNAVYNSDNPQTLNFGPAVARPAVLRGVSARNISLAFFQDQVRLLWTDTANQRINMLSGTLSANGITFSPTVQSTSAANEEISEPVVVNDTLFVAVRTTSGVELRRKTAANLPLAVHATCTNTGPFRGRLLFRDSSNVFWVSESAMPQNSTNVRLRSFSDCSTRDIEAPIVFGQLQYHPGRP